MSLSGLPTDNLYKFLAISGVALCIFSFITPLDRVRETSKQLAECEADLAMLRAEISEFNDEAKWKLKNPGSQVIKLDDLIEKNKRIRDANIKLIRQVELIKHLNELLTRDQKTYSTLYKFGSSVALLGFMLWYLQVQRPMDKAAKQALLPPTPHNTERSDG